MTMTSAQARLDNAILAHEHAESEVERLCDILERAADALARARQAKRAAQKELDEAAKAANASSAAAPSPNGASSADDGDGRRRKEEDEVLEGEDDQSEYSDEDGEDGEEYSSEGSEEEEDEEEDEEEGEDDEDDGFDMGNEALEQIRYRLETARIDPNSPEGTKLLDELLVRLQGTKETGIDAGLINRFIDELLLESDDPQNNANDDQNDVNPPPLPPPQDPRNQNQSRMRISRGGKVLGWYQGSLDSRGYAREGSGSMYYDAGHECHGTWRDDEMIGRGVYRWSDGHVYDGEWLAGKRHGLGRFVRPDGVVLYGRYEGGHHRGEGVRWSADRKEAQVVVDGVPTKTVGLAKAKEIAAQLGFDDVLPPPV